MNRDIDAGLNKYFLRYFLRGSSSFVADLYIIVLRWTRPNLIIENFRGTIIEFLDIRHTRFSLYIRHDQRS